MSIQLIVYLHVERHPTHSFMSPLLQLVGTSLHCKQTLMQLLGNPCPPFLSEQLAIARLFTLFEGCTVCQLLLIQKDAHMIIIQICVLLLS